MDVAVPGAEGHGWHLVVAVGEVGDEYMEGLPAEMTPVRGERFQRPVYFRRHGKGFLR